MFHNANHSFFAPYAVTLAPLAEYGDQDQEINIPENILGSHYVNGFIQIDCSKHRLSIHPDAFRLSGRSTQLLGIRNCDLNSTDLAGLLSDFKQLDTFFIEKCNHLDLAIWSNTALFLTNLTSLSIVESRDLNKWFQFPNVTGKMLSELTLIKNKIDNVAMDRILRWISSFAVNSLNTLHIRHNNLTRIPKILPSFTALINFNMRSQAVPGLGSIPTGALHLSSRMVEQLDLEDCGITKIEPGAIQGVFKKHKLKSFRTC